MSFADSYHFARFHGATVDTAFKFAIVSKTKQLLNRFNGAK